MRILALFIVVLTLAACGNTSGAHKLASANLINLGIPSAMFNEVVVTAEYELRKSIPEFTLREDSAHVVELTDEKLFHNNKWVGGYASSSTYAQVSTYGLEHWSYEQSKDWLVYAIIHELGHQWGLRHEEGCSDNVMGTDYCDYNYRDRVVFSMEQLEQLRIQ